MSRAKKRAYPDSAPSGESRSKGGYKSESWGTGRYPKGSFPPNYDFAGKADGVLGKIRAKQDPALPSRESKKAFPRNPGQD